MNIIFKFIKKTNGDVLGVILFIFLLIHFWYLEEQTKYTIFLSIGCVAALIVDFMTCYNTINKL